MDKLTAAHYTYALFIIIIIGLMVMKKDIMLMSLIGLFTIGYIYSGNILTAIQTIYNGVITSGIEFWSIIVIISLIVSMSNVLRDIGADVLIIKPINKYIKSPTTAYFMMGIMMMVMSFILWPSPAVALIGAIILPASIKAGLPAIWAASVMNIFGHGIALSGDFFIQGAPSITAKSMGYDDPFVIIKAQLPLWITMSVVTVLVSYILMRRDLKNNKVEDVKVIDEEVEVKHSFGVKLVAILTPILFLVNIFLMYRYELKGGDAAALISGTSVFIMILSIMLNTKVPHVMDAVGKYIKDGFIFGISTFAPVLIVGAFFFLGNKETSVQILGNDAPGYLSDLGLYLSTKVHLNKISVIIMQSITSGIAGLGGAGFSALPLVGTISETLSSVVEINEKALAGLGQLIAMWVGGGTVIPWGVITVSAICKVSPTELVKKNIIPVFAGFIATIIVAIFLL